MKKFTGREKRFLYVGIVLALAIGVYYVTSEVLPDRELFHVKVETQKATLLKQRSLLQREEFYKKRADDAASDFTKIKSRLLPGNSASVAGAELQRILKDYADQSDVEITQKSNLAERKVPDSDSLVKVAVRIDTNCTIDELVDFLTAIENYDKFLKVEELTINSFRVQKRYEIRPSLTIAGYISVPAPPASPAAPAAKEGTT